MQSQDDNTLSAVRQMLKEADRAPASRRRRPSVEADPAPARAASVPQDKQARMRPVGRAAGGETAAVGTAAEAGTAGAGRRSLGERLKGYEPKKAHGVILMFLAVTLWSPWLIPGLLFLAMWVALIVYFTLGPDRVSELAQLAWAGFEKRRPERAQRLLERIQRGADRIDGWLAWLPESWTDGIYLPDLGRSRVEESGETRDALERDPFDKLNRQREAVAAEAQRVPGMPLRS